MAIAVAENLQMTYKIGELEIKAIDGINMQIEKGEFLSIVGPSGSGKTTLLHLIGCLDSPTAGSLYIDGKDISKMSAREVTRLRRNSIGFVFQEFNLLPVLTARENVELPLRYKRVSAEQRHELATEALSMVGLSGRADNKPAQLSGGEQQRVAIARALVARPALVLADEPTGELDTPNKCKVIELMRELNEKLELTFAIVTHDIMVAEYTERVVFLRDGKIIEDRKGKSGESVCRMEPDKGII